MAQMDRTSILCPTCGALHVWVASRPGQPGIVENAPPRGLSGSSSNRLSPARSLESFRQQRYEINLAGGRFALDQSIDNSVFLELAMARAQRLGGVQVAVRCNARHERPNDQTAPDIERQTDRRRRPTLSLTPAACRLEPPPRAGPVCPGHEESKAPNRDRWQHQPSRQAGGFAAQTPSEEINKTRGIFVETLSTPAGDQGSSELRTTCNRILW